LRITNKHIIFFFLLLCTFTGLQAQVVTAEVDSAHFMIGDQLKYRLKIKDAVTVENPRADLSKLDTSKIFEIVKELDWEKIVNEKDTYYQKELTITSFDSGYYYFPSVKVFYEKNGTKASRNTQQIQLAVITPQIDSLSIRPIKDIIKEPVRIEDFYPIMMTVALILFFGFLAYFLYKRFSNKPVVEVYVAPPAAHEVALEKLQVLKNKELWQQGKIKEYQSELTYIVREYLEERFEMQALESTTEEIVHELNEKDITEEHKVELTDMFRMADMVKFAKATPPVDIQSTLLNKAIQFVERTKQEVIVESKTSAE
jgi:hypothetical protein